MTSNAIKAIMRKQGREDALALAARAAEMTGTEIIKEEDHVPAWREDANYTAAMVGYPVKDEGQVYTILMPHTPAHNPGSRPADLRSIYSLLHTTDPFHAKPWMPSYGISGLYKFNEVCTYPNAEGAKHVWRNLWEGNEYPPMTLNVESRWEDLGEAAAYGL